MLSSFDALLLARLQFAFTVSFHFLFPALTIGLASYLAVLNAMWLRTKNHAYLELFRYWVKIFSLAFGMGVVSGIVMSYQFGTNWAVFSDRAGPVIGAPMAYEVLSAFFLEAGFLGIMLFGRERVGPALHMGACLAVAIGTVISSFWIISVNSWMHTPQGFRIDPETMQFLPTNFWEVIFNPSFPYRLLHTVTAAYLSTAFVVGGVAAYHLIKRNHAREERPETTRIMFSMAMWMATIFAPIQIFLGDQHGLNTLEYQPQKIMAIEGHYESHDHGAPLYVFGIPNDEEQRLEYAVGIPKLGSLILKHDLNAPMAGLDTIPDDEQPPAFIIFWTFRIMVAIGFAMLLIGAWSLISRLRGKLYEDKWLLRAVMLMTPAGSVAIIAGWVTTEVGRQPYTIWGLMRTSESASALDASSVGASLIAFIVVYTVVFGAGSLYMLRLMARAPVSDEPDLEDVSEAPSRASGTTPGAETAARRPQDMKSGD